MELDRTLLSQLTALDNETLADATRRVASSMGIDPSLASLYLGDMDRIKKSIANLTDKDFQRITAAMGEEEMGRLVNEIRREVTP